MGIQAPKSHGKGVKHLKLKTTICNVKAITSFTTSSPDITSKPDYTAKVSEVLTYSKKETLKKSPSIGFYLFKDEVTKADIGWYMRTVKIQSYNSCKKVKDLFFDMFRDSEIAGSVLGPMKASHVIYYGLAPFYKQKIMKQLTSKATEPPYFVWCFVNTFTGVSNPRQF